MDISISVPDPIFAVIPLRSQRTKYLKDEYKKELDRFHICHIPNEWDIVCLFNPNIQTKFDD